MDQMPSRCSSRITESGSAIMQVVMLAGFLGLITFVFSSFLGRHDRNSLRVIDRTVFSQLGEWLSDTGGNPRVLHESQKINTTQAYP